MEATELRINNLVKDQLTGEFMKISDLSENKITAEVINRSEYPLPAGWKMIPIPLTEEILLKCKFHELNEFENKCIDKDNFIEISSVLEDEFYIGKNKETGFYHFLTIDTFQGDDLFFKSISAPMQYLHTLQNYYVTFKGEELEINL